MTRGPAAPGVSVIVAVDGEPPSLIETLEAVAAQRDEAVEVLAITTSVPRPAWIERFPWVEWRRVAAGSLVPDLWAEGITASRFEVVALTSANFRPSGDWIRSIRSAHLRLGVAAIGGAIDPPPAAGSSAIWAAYYLRYGRLRRLSVGRCEDLAAENVSYRGSDLRWWTAETPGGFWEPDFHRSLLRRGETLVYEPAIAVRLVASFGTWRFCRRRVSHGRQYGRARVAGASILERLARLTTSPLVPLLLVARAGRFVEPGERRRFATALPALTAFAVCWGLGEAWGYLEALLRDGRTRD